MRTTSLELVPLLTLFFVSQAAGQEEKRIVRVVPVETDEILANPGMGWQTFHRTSKQDKNLPSWIPSTVHYARWGWRELEPQPGKIDDAFLDKVLKESHDSGQKLAFRVMCCSTSGGEPYHPDMDHVDLGSVGWWGEWHLSDSKNCKLPTPENRKKIVDAYLSAFRRTPLLMLVNGGECLTYATRCGTGWRADSLGEMGFLKKWSHMKSGYPTWIKEAGVQEAWKTAPVAWETGGDMRHWVAVGWSLRYILNYALALHGSYINNKSAPLPSGDNVRPEIERFLRRLGYRLVLKELTHPAQVRSGDKVELGMKWQNVGSAPCYKPYRVAYRLTSQGGQQRVFVSNVTVNKWLPGSVELFTEEFFRQPADLPPGDVAEVRDAIRLPGDLAPGKYTVSIAVVGEKDEQPVVRLGIKGRGDDGWYPLSKVSVTQ